MNANRTNLILPPLEDGVVVEGGDSVAVVEPGADLHVHHLSHVVWVTHSRRILDGQIGKYRDRKILTDSREYGIFSKV